MRDDPLEVFAAGALGATVGSPADKAAPWAIPTALDAPSVRTFQEGPALLRVLTLFQRGATTLVLRLSALLKPTGLEDATRLLQGIEIYGLAVALVFVVFFAQLVPCALEQRGILGGRVAGSEGEVTEARGCGLVRICATGG